MWYIIVSFIVVIGVAVFIYIREGLEVSLLIAFFIVALFFILSFSIYGITTGLGQQYSIGKRTGFITKLSHKGVIWKTYEGEMQIGTGDISSLQTPVQFSIVDKEILAIVEKSLGKKVTIHYEEWLIMPYRIGNSGYEVVNIEKEGGKK